MNFLLGPTLISTHTDDSAFRDTHPLSQEVYCSGFSTETRTNSNETPQSRALMLYYSPACPYSQKVLKYLQQIHKTIPMKSVANDPIAKKELREYGGKMQVPCLLIDGKPLYESDAIILWLSQHQESLNSA